MYLTPHRWIAVLPIIMSILPCWAAPETTKAKIANNDLKEEIVLDAIVASVDDKPITLSDLNARLMPPRRLGLREAASDQEAIKTLDAIILERLVELEATAKRLSISDAEVEDYVQEVASRNSMSIKDFQLALAKEGQSIDWYKKQVRFDILRTKLSSTVMRGGASVSDGEIDQYLTDHPVLSHTTTSIKLSTILISSERRSPEELQARVLEVLSALEAGEAFNAVAQRLSDGPNRADGGSLGLIAEQDLSRDVFDAVFALKAGSHSRPIEGDKGVQIFFIEQRFAAGEDSDNEENQKALRDEARSSIQKQKTQARLSSYFVSDLYKNHSVDKKL